MSLLSFGSRILLFLKLFRVGLAMAELAATHVKDLKPKSNRDDYFITGFLRERLPWISLRLNNTFDKQTGY